MSFVSKRTVGGAEWSVVERVTEQRRRDSLLANEIARGKAATKERERRAAVSVVYYVRTGRYVKIGYTSNLKARLVNLRLDATEVLATESGGRTLEAQRHAQFADERIGKREDFVLSFRLQEHIRELQDA